MAANSDERRKRWRRRKRRKYTAAKRMEILNAVEEAGVVEAARRHGVPQTTVSNWLHRDATKVVQEQAVQQAADGAGGAKVTRKAREATMMVSEETAGAKATTAPEGRLTEARDALRRVLVHRQLTPSKDDDARIEACTDLATLKRWQDRAFTALSVSDALG